MQHCIWIFVVFLHRYFTVVFDARTLCVKCTKKECSFSSNNKFASKSLSKVEFSELCQFEFRFFLLWKNNSTFCWCFTDNLTLQGYETELTLHTLHILRDEREKQPRIYMLVRSKTKAVSELKRVRSPTHLLTTFYTIIKQNERNKLNKIEEKL